MKLVHDFFAAHETHGRVDQSRTLRAPQQLVAIIVDTGIRQHDDAVHFPFHYLVTITGKQSFAVPQGDIDREVVCLVSDDACFKAYGISFYLGRPADFFDVIVWHLLKPDCLPDSSRPRVPDGVWLKLPILLPARLGKLMWVISHLDRHGLLPGGIEHVGDVSPEGCMTTLVGHRQASIDPDPREIVDRAETQDYPP